MSVHIDIEVTGDEAFVTVRGVIDRRLPDIASALGGLGDGCRSVVVDLRDAVLTSPRGLNDLVSALGHHAEPERIALVCDRLPGRRLLRLACGMAGVRVLGEVPPRVAQPAG